jgi:PhnB protein
MAIRPSRLTSSSTAPARAIDFYKQVFGATERMRCPPGPNRIGHAEIMIGGSLLMLADEFP